MKEKIIEKIKQFGIIEIIVLALYIIILLTVAVNHEYYEDEAQSWLIARDLNFVEIIEQMKYEGHSVLWYYIIAPFAKLGFSVNIQTYISCLFAIATVYIILKKAPFNKITKILLTFSGGMIFLYSVIARPYCLIPFLLVCISIIYRKRKERQYLYAVLIGLLAHTHLIMLPTAIMLSISFWGQELIIKRQENSKEEKKTLYKSLLIAVFFIMIFILIVVFTISNCAIISNVDKTDRVTSISKCFTLIKITSLDTIKNIYGASGEIPAYFKILVGIVIGLCLIGSKKNIKQALIFWSQFIFTLLIHSFLWFIMPMRVYIIIYTLMFWLWNYREDEQYKKNPERNLFIEIALILLIIISAPSIYKLSYEDITSEFSTGEITAKYIQEHIPKNSCFICTDMESQQSVIAYLKKDDYKFYMPNSKEYITFITWNKEWNTNITEKNIKEAIQKLKLEYENLYVIGNRNNIENSEFIYSSQDKVNNNFYFENEIYSIYKIEDKN